MSIHNARIPILRDALSLLYTGKVSQSGTLSSLRGES